MKSLSKFLCRGNLQFKCNIIGMIHASVCSLDILSHLMILGLVTKCFQCEINGEDFTNLHTEWYRGSMLILNVGSHGLYPLPAMLGHDGANFTSNPQCYYGMVHLYVSDVLSIFINIIWLRLVLSFMEAVDKKKRDHLRVFFGVSIVKLLIQVMYYAYDAHNRKEYMEYLPLRIADVVIATAVLFIINEYIKELKPKNATKNKGTRHKACVKESSQKEIKDEEKDIISNDKKDLIQEEIEETKLQIST